MSKWTTGFPIGLSFPLGLVILLQLRIRAGMSSGGGDLEAGAVVLPTLAVQLAFRELNRDACRPAVYDAAS
jgi:hypothetical protein